jgi:hypothetical protein
MLTLNHIRIHEESKPLEAMTPEERRIAMMASRWTGR